VFAVAHAERKQAARRPLHIGRKLGIGSPVTELRENKCIVRRETCRGRMEYLGEGHAVDPGNCFIAHAHSSNRVVCSIVIQSWWLQQARDRNQDGAMPTIPDGRSLIVLAWANVLLHVAGMTLAALGMSPGTPLAPLPERMAYLAATPVAWTLGWVSWMLCALLLVAFLAVLVQRLGDDAALARFALMIAIAGLPIDLFCDAVFIFGLPMIAAWQPPAEPLFLVVERVTGVGSLVIANGAYSVAILLVSRVLQDRASIGLGTVMLGYAVGVGGLLLVAAGFTGVPWHAQWATPPTIGLFCVWVVLVARSVERGNAQ
jgi:hypothetical protein